MMFWMETVVLPDFFQIELIDLIYIIDIQLLKYTTSLGDI